ncbi:MAG: type II toxin-antitoxin system RelB/DinJ family antitoxin [Caldilinea sp. CFX5]|nr:type II toxin-antitoxin system RelB/DinJ family antitoxin [Caldilinea sp. CFX5]
MQKVAAISARIDPQLKRSAETIFEKLGLTASQAISLFYRQVQLQRGLPFAVKLQPEDERPSVQREAAHRPSEPAHHLQDTLGSGQSGVDPFLLVLQENQGPAYWSPPTQADLLMTQEEIAYRLLHAELLAQFEGKFVAIYRGQVIDSDSDQLALVRRVAESHPNQVVLIRQVLGRPEPELRLRSPRFVEPLA